jgi:hypothetical protein
MSAVTAQRICPQFHAELGAAVIQVLGRALPSGCKAYSSDLMIRIDASDLSTSPDVAVVRGSQN